MKVFELMQVLLLAFSWSSQIKAYTDEHPTITKYNGNTSNQTSDLRHVTVDYVSSSEAKGANGNPYTTNEGETANELSKREIIERIVLSEGRTVLAFNNISLDVLQKSSGDTSHVSNLSKTALPAMEIAGVTSLPVSGDVKTGLRRSPREIPSHTTTTSDGHSENTNLTDNDGQATISVCCQAADEGRSATLPEAHTTSNEPKGDRNRNVRNISEFSNASLSAASKIASMTPSAFWQSMQSFSGSATISASSISGAAATNARAAVVIDGVWNQNRTTIRLGDTNKSSITLENAQVRAENITGYPITSGNGGNHSAAQEEALTTTVTTEFADVTSKVIKNSPASDDDNAPGNQQLVIIIAASAGAIAAAALLIAVVLIVYQVRRRRIIKKKLRHQEPRVSVLWPQTLHRNSVLVPRDAYICIPSEQLIALVEDHLHTEATGNSVLSSFNDVAT